MNRLNFIVLTVTLLFSQLGSLDHAYSEHQVGEVCDYCVSAPPLDNAITSSIAIDFSNNNAQQHNGKFQESFSTKAVRFYATRAPPRLT